MLFFFNIFFYMMITVNTLIICLDSKIRIANQPIICIYLPTSLFNNCDWFFFICSLFFVFNSEAWIIAICPFLSV